MQPTYNISLIPQDMLQENTILQIAKTLEYMENVCDQIFSRIGTRISENRSRVDALHSRIAAARDKINAFAGSRKATVVFSCTKYPASELHKPYESCFSKNSGLKMAKAVLKCQERSLKKVVKPTSDTLVDKLHFYHVKMNENVEEKNQELIDSENLKTIPRKSKSVCDLLLFNSPKNPYYIQIDSVINQKRALELQDHDVKINMDAPPQSISSGESLIRREDKGYFYSPNLGEVPSIDVPIDLPDLPGIADDLRYDLEVGQTIAPSSGLSILPELSSVQEIVPTTKTTPLVVPISLEPPKAPNLNEPPAGKNPIEMEEIDIKPIPPPPPPPPPPPVIPEEIVSPTESLPVPKIDSRVINIADESRANLMESIRNATGILKLKPVKPTEDAAGVSSGGLMGELHAKLSMRRKGISGNKSGEGEVGGKVGDAMSRISMMIPPPDTPTTATDDDDDDWS